MSRAPRFEVVRTDAGWHARFRAANGRIVWATEVYTRRVGAEDAVALLAIPHDARLTRVGVRTITDKVPPIEVRTVDERTEDDR